MAQTTKRKGAQSCSVRDVRIETDDGVRLAATEYGSAEPLRGVVVVSSAIAMPRQYYDAFATWFAERGFRVVTYDYRGIGGSPPADLRRCESDLGDWFHLDMPAVLRWAKRGATGTPLYLIGHSLGGQAMGLVGDRFDIEAAATIAAQSGYWRYQYPGERLKMVAYAYALGPLVTRWRGYLPWSEFFGGEDVPKAAALQWMKWCRHPKYLFGDDDLDGRENFARFSAPIRAYSFEDDPWGYREAVDWMMDQYTDAAVERVHLAPQEVGLDKIGHFGFFRLEMTSEWEELVEWFE